MKGATKIIQLLIESTELSNVDPSSFRVYVTIFPTPTIQDEIVLRQPPYLLYAEKE